MQDFNKKYDYFVSVINNIQDDKHLVYVATLDALHKWDESDLSLKIVNKFIENEIRTSKNKLTGITLALIELQRVKFIPDYLLATLRGLVERFVYEDDDYINYEWIKNIFVLCRRAFSGTKFLWLVSLINNSNRELPEKYASSIIEVINHWAVRNSNNQEVISYYKSAAIRTKDLLLAKDEFESKQSNQNRLMLLNVLYKLCSFNEKIWGKLIVNTMPIQDFFYKFFLNPSRFYGFIGATTPIIAFMGHFSSENGNGLITFPAVYVLISLLIRSVFLRKFGNPNEMVQQAH